MSEMDAIVIIGGGHAAAQLCAGLTDAGVGARVHLVCEESHLPYHRPPLSKAFLKKPEETLQFLRTESWYRDSGITVHRGDPALAIDRDRRIVALRSRQELRYGHLVLATGARPRGLPHLPGGLANALTLRSADDATNLREQIYSAAHVTVLGGGFIGLEIAATAQSLGKSVMVLEATPRLLMRSVSPELAQHILETHRNAGIDVRLGVSVGDFEIGQGRVCALSVNGERQGVELLVVGIGASPEHRLASDAGLSCANGIVVDSRMRTSDPEILAVGDCTSFPEHRGSRHIRLESVQNANDQARTAVATLLGRDEPYCALPWFWSDQGTLRLQMAGLMPAGGTSHRRSVPGNAGFSIFHYLDDRLVCVESVNAPLDHLAARKLLEQGKSPAPTLVCDGAVPLKAHV